MIIVIMARNSHSLKTFRRQRMQAAGSSLLRDIRKLIEQARSRVARATNVTLTVTYWMIGERIRREVLQEQRAEYGSEIIDKLAAKLIVEFGRGFNRTNLFNMVRFAEVFPNHKIVHSLSGQLTWTHLRILIYLKKPLQREFYAAMCADQRWSVRELQRQINGMLYERVALSKKPDAVIDKCIKSLRETGEMTPEMVFLDHVNLSALGLRDDLSSERDLENAMLQEIEIVLRELGTSFAFIKRQYRFRLDNDTFTIDLLFYNRRLRALVAVDLKLGKFEPAHFGQMELYLRWLEKHEMLSGESRPYGLVLCAGRSQERVELLRLGEHGIHVAEYMTELPPQDLLKAQLHEAIERARERVAIRESEPAKETAA
jgi:predicted nuclease of restriction endonuclease-like (RecB) superfamily